MIHTIYVPRLSALELNVLIRLGDRPGVVAQSLADVGHRERMRRRSALADAPIEAETFHLLESIPFDLPDYEIALGLREIVPLALSADLRAMPTLHRLLASVAMALASDAAELLTGDGGAGAGLLID